MGTGGGGAWCLTSAGIWLSLGAAGRRECVVCPPPCLPVHWVHAWCGSQLLLQVDSTGQACVVQPVHVSRGPCSLGSS